MNAELPKNPTSVPSRETKSAISETCDHIISVLLSACDDKRIRIATSLEATLNEVLSSHSPCSSSQSARKYSRDCPDSPDISSRNRQRPIRGGSSRRACHNQQSRYRV